MTNNASETSTLTVGDDDRTSDFAGTITDGSGSVALVKVGGGTLALSHGDTYSGGTILDAGTLSFADRAGERPNHFRRRHAEMGRRQHPGRSASSPIPAGQAALLNTAPTVDAGGPDLRRRRPRQNRLRNARR